MKILLLGANGQLGTELLVGLAPLGQLVPATREGVLRADRSACELANLQHPEQLQALLRRVRPDVVVNAAGFTAVDPAEAQRALAFTVNAHAPAALAQGCAELDALLVHYSTDYVFDGALKRLYREDDIPHPLNAYGESKLAGEQAVRSSAARHLVLRVSWIFAAHGNSFLRNVLRWSDERDRLQVVDDQVGIPTSARLIAYATQAAIRQAQQLRSLSGLWHLTASGQTSRHAFAEAVVREGYARGLIGRMPRVDPISSDQFPAAAMRPHYSALDNHAFQSMFAIELPNWYEGMVQTLDELAAPG